MQKPKRPGLVLSGGGARGAYQAGVLKGIAEITSKRKKETPFPFVSGVSAGAINAVFLAAESHDFLAGSQKLCDLWTSLTTDKVFRTDVPSLGKIGFRWLLDLLFGGAHRRTKANSLLDTAPLRALLEREVALQGIAKNIDAGVLEALAVTATNYNTSSSVTFVQGKSDIPMWERSRRFSEKAMITIDHVMGSAAIPLFFPPAPIGQHFFGDGCLRNLAPLSPAIRMGSDRLVVISIRKQGFKQSPKEATSFRPSIARVLSVLLNSVFMDATDIDIERLASVNSTLDAVAYVSDTTKQRMTLRPVPYLWIQPSEDIGALAKVESHRLPQMIRYLLGGLGTLEEASEIISYLLFEPEFCKHLVYLGYRDAMSRKDEIEDFILPTS